MNNKAYTLIEVLVAISIFFIVIAAPTGFFVGSLRGQQKALSTQELLNNVSYNLEYISRAIRMAKKDKAGNCLSIAKNNYQAGDSSIRFLNYDDKCQEFFLEGGMLKVRKSTDSTSANFGSPLLLTPESLEVITFKTGSSASWDQTDNEQPRVTLFLEVKGSRGQAVELQPKIQIQTTITQRNLDVMY